MRNASAGFPALSGDGASSWGGLNAAPRFFIEEVEKVRFSLPDPRNNWLRDSFEYTGKSTSPNRFTGDNHSRAGGQWRKGVLVCGEARPMRAVHHSAG